MEPQCNRCDLTAPNDPCGILFYITGPTALPKLMDQMAGLQFHLVDAIPNTLLIKGDTEKLTELARDWRERLTSVESAEVRGALMVKPFPTIDDIARALLNLKTLDEVRTQLEGRWLWKVIDDRSFVSRFQPIVSLHDRRIVAYECLLRGEMKGEIIGAPQIFSTASALGLTHHIDQLARRVAVTNGRGIMNAGLDLFINFTPNAIYDPKHCLKDTVAVCREFGVSMNQIVFEVVEAEEICDLPHLKRVIAEYRSLGARIALDDLGSGYSSINYLLELRPDIVKLDQGLVRGASGDRVRSILVKALTDAAHALDITVVAEGVETAKDLQFSVELGIDMAQGYFIARPAESMQPMSEESLAVLEALAPRVQAATG